MNKLVERRELRLELKKKIRNKKKKFFAFDKFCPNVAGQAFYFMYISYINHQFSCTVFFFFHFKRHKIQNWTRTWHMDKNGLIEDSKRSTDKPQSRCVKENVGEGVDNLSQNQRRPRAAAEPPQAPGRSVGMSELVSRLE